MRDPAEYACWLVTAPAEYADVAAALLKQAAAQAQGAVYVVDQEMAARVVGDGDSRAADDAADDEPYRTFIEQSLDSHKLLTGERG